MTDNITNRWAWFDLDDTLWNFSQNSLLTLHEIYPIFKLDRYWSDVNSWIDDYHAANSALWRRYERGEVDTETLRVERFSQPLSGAGYDGDDILAFSKELDTRYLSMLGAKSLTVHGARELLERARRLGYHVGVLSNGFSDVQYNKLKNSGLDRYVERVVLSEEVGYNKPDRRIFDCACQMVGATADDSIMVGDNPSTDIAGAVSAGWRAIWFNPNHIDSPVPAGVPVVDSLDKIFAD